MAAVFESRRGDRRYEVDERGVAEFGRDSVLRRFIPWAAVERVELAHKASQRELNWSVRSGRGGRITPKLEYLKSLDCYNAVVYEWRSRVPHLCREHYRRVYRRFRRAHLLVHLLWMIPASLCYLVVGLTYAVTGAVDWPALKGPSGLFVVGYVLCLVVNLLGIKVLREGFDPYYAHVEASFDEGGRAAPGGSNEGVAGATVAEAPMSDQEYRVYRRWEVSSILPFFLSWGLLGCAWYFGLVWAARLFSHDALGTRFLLEPSGIYWAIPAMFLGMVTSVVPLDLLYRVLLSDRYRRWERYCNERGGRVWKWAFWGMAVLIVAGAAAFFVAGVTSFARFTDQGIELGRPFTFRSRFYGYTRVRAIEHRATFQAPSGNTVRREHFMIRFDDGTEWSSRDGLRDPVPELDGRVAQFVSETSKRPIIERP